MLLHSFHHFAALDKVEAISSCQEQLDGQCICAFLSIIFYTSVQFLSSPPTGIIGHTYTLSRSFSSGPSLAAPGPNDKHSLENYRLKCSINSALPEARHSSCYCYVLKQKDTPPQVAVRNSGEKLPTLGKEFTRTHHTSHS